MRNSIGLERAIEHDNYILYERATRVEKSSPEERAIYTKNS